MSRWQRYWALQRARIRAARGGSGQVYGAAVPFPTPAVYTKGSNTTLTAGTETTFITTGALTAYSPGTWYPLIFLTADILQGGTAAAALKFAFKLGSGSDVDSYVCDPNLLVNSGTQTWAVTLVGTPSNSNWAGSGSTINITGLATTTACTVVYTATRAVVLLLPAT